MEHLDKKTTIATLKEAVNKFVDERNWKPYNTPKNIATSIVVEAAELLELFTWMNDEQVADYLKKNRFRAEEELSDVLFNVLLFAQQNNIDITSAFQQKMILNGKKYPLES